MKLLLIFTFFFGAFFSLASCNEHFEKKWQKIKQIEESFFYPDKFKSTLIHEELKSHLNEIGIDYQEIIFEQKKFLQITPQKQGSSFNKLAFLLNKKDNIKLMASHARSRLYGGVYYKNQAIITSIEELFSGKIGTTTRHEIHHWLLGNYPPSLLFSAVLNSKKSIFFSNDSLIANYGNYFEFGELFAYGFELEFISKSLQNQTDPLLIKKYKKEWMHIYQKIESFLFETEQKLNQFSILLSENKIKVLTQDNFIFLDDGSTELKILNIENNYEKSLKELIKEINLYKIEFKKINSKEDVTKLIQQCRQFKLWMYKKAFNFN